VAGGTIQCDGYSAYDRFARHRAIEARPVLLAGCWAHARRGFYEALDHAPKEAGWVLIQTQIPASSYQLTPTTHTKQRRSIFCKRDSDGTGDKRLVSATRESERPIVC
jgi:Transposase IS66 family